MCAQSASRLLIAPRGQIDFAHQTRREAGLKGWRRRCGIRRQFDPDSLSVRGWQRAGALAVLFGAPGARGAQPELVRPTEPYAAVDVGRSRRPQDTLRPIAELLRLPIRQAVSSGDQRPLAARIFASPEDVLVCWRHRELPILARALLPRSAHVVPAHWDAARFDLVWVIKPDSLLIVPQRLLAGDARYRCCVTSLRVRVLTRHSIYLLSLKSHGIARSEGARAQRRRADRSPSGVVIRTTHSIRCGGMRRRSTTGINLKVVHLHPGR